jgi:hypothetical protein
MNTAPAVKMQAQKIEAQKIDANVNRRITIMG